MRRKSSQIITLAVSALLLISCRGNKDEIPSLVKRDSWGTPQQISFTSSTTTIRDDERTNNIVSEQYQLYEDGFRNKLTTTVNYVPSETHVDAYHQDGKTYFSKVLEEWDIYNDEDKAIYKRLLNTNFTVGVATLFDEYVRLYDLIIAKSEESSLAETREYYTSTYPGANVDVTLTRMGENYLIKERITAYLDDLYIEIRNDYTVRVLNGRPTFIEFAEQTRDFNGNVTNLTRMTFFWEDEFPPYPEHLK